MGGKGKPKVGTGFTLGRLLLLAKYFFPNSTTMNLCEIKISSI
jgi:hypothetical protein